MTAAADARVLFFDVDGCLVDSTVPIHVCLDAALSDFGLPPIPADQLDRHIGPPLQVTLTTLLTEMDEDPALLPLLMAAYRERYAHMSIDEARSYPGVPELIEALDEAGERLGVVTSKPRRFAVPILDALDLSQHFEVMFGPEETEAEPKTATLRRALAAVAPCDVASSLMIGDRHHDIDAAHNHGMSGIGVTWGFGSRTELETADAVAVVDSPAQLAAFLAA
jgi:phosphoglycolate phosphatase